jgi:hypothetical protein
MLITSCVLVILGLIIGFGALVAKLTSKQSMKMPDIIDSIIVSPALHLLYIVLGILSLVILALAAIFAIIGVNQ